MEQELGDGRRSLLGGDEINYTDITFAALSGLWMMPENYGGANLGFQPVNFDRMPETMQKDIVLWRETYPLTIAYIERLYAEER